jgi:glycosyltransferase involved in cell wall biosynthesis
MRGLDVMVLSSAFGEGFPNVVGEAMATGVPCVVTDVGDAARLVGDCGLSLPPRDPKALAAALRAMLAMPKPALAALGAKGRQRVTDEFSLEAVLNDYAALWRSVVADDQAGR